MKIMADNMGWLHDLPLIIYWELFGVCLWIEVELIFEGNWEEELFMDEAIRIEVFMVIKIELTEVY